MRISNSAADLRACGELATSPQSLTIKFINGRAKNADLAFTAYDLGFGTGKFVDLKLIHLMPSKRLQQNYLLKLAEGNGYSELIFESLRNEVKPYKVTWKHKLYEWYRCSKMSPVERRMYQAKERGKQLAMKELFNAK